MKEQLVSVGLHCGDPNCKGDCLKEELTPEKLVDVIASAHFPHLNCTPWWEVQLRGYQLECSTKQLPCVCAMVDPLILVALDMKPEDIEAILQGLIRKLEEDGLIPTKDMPGIVEVVEKEILGTIQVKMKKPAERSKRSPWK